MWGPGGQQVEEEPAVCSCKNQGWRHQLHLWEEQGQIKRRESCVLQNGRQRWQIADRETQGSKSLQQLTGAEKLCHLSWVKICLGDDQNTTEKGSNLTQDLGELEERLGLMPNRGTFHLKPFCGIYKRNLLKPKQSKIRSKCTQKHKMDLEMHQKQPYEIALLPLCMRLL